MIFEKGSKEMVAKQRRLERVRIELKEEFVGIDKVIDQVIDLVSSWYLLPDIQDKPVVVNLWGLTGVGKSSLIQRLADLLEYNEKYYRFNLGSDDLDWAITGQLDDIYCYDNGFPIMMALDEFQHARSIDKMGAEKDKYSKNIIWELLDSGKYTTTRISHYTDSIYKLNMKLQYALSCGVSVEKGMVVSNKKLFERILNDDDKHFISSEEGFDDNIYFVPLDYHMEIFDMASEKFQNPYEVREILMNLEGKATVDFINEMLSFALSPKKIDCSKAIIFVLGNLDEAYSMSNSYNPDMDSDEFHKQSLEINITNIKDALRERFRNEQIARLGNNHIIYPAFDKDSFEKIIWLELNRISKKFQHEFQVNLIFDDSLVQFIYNEGVFPTQGTRPVLSTIYQLVGSRLGKLFTTQITQNINADSIIVKAENNKIRFNYVENKSQLYSFTETPVLSLSKLRHNNKDDMQAIVAVHESGHAILSSFLLNTIPEVIFSKTADKNSEGFVFAKFKWDYVSKKEIIPRIAFFLGGIVAEKLIFGEENHTNGSENDIEKATLFATKMIKESGMGDLLASYQVAGSETNNYLFDINNLVNTAVEKLMDHGRQLALEILKKQEGLLIQMSNYLSDNTVMRKEDIKDFLIKHGIKFNVINIIDKGDNLFYRNHLKQRFEELNQDKNSKTFDKEKSAKSYMLNKKYD